MNLYMDIVSIMRIGFPPGKGCDMMVSISKDDFVFVAGGGRFGMQSARIASEGGAVTVVSDTDPECRCAKAAQRVCGSADDIDWDMHGRVQFLLSDGPQALEDVFARRVPSIVVPSMPGHMLGWAFAHRMRMQERECLPCPDYMEEAMARIPERLHLRSDAGDAVLVLSRMPEGMLCNDPCPQPEKCPVTGDVREMPLYRLIDKELSEIDGCGLVLHSILLSQRGGVGGIVGDDLHDALELACACHGRVALATSCSCHAVINFFEVE